MPLWPVGIPLPPPRGIVPETPPVPTTNVNEPVAMVGTNTGKVHAIANDRQDGLPEQISVSPPAGAPPDPGMKATGAVSMADGGVVNPQYDPNEVARLLELQRQQQQQQLQQQQGILQNRNAIIGSQQTGLGLQRAVTMAEAGTFGAQQGVINARQATIGPKQAVIGAQGAVLGAREAQLGGSRSLINLQQSQNEAEKIDIGRIRNAAANVNDKVAVAMEQQRRGVEDQTLYGRLGVAPPVEIATPMGTTTTPAGTRAKLVDQEGRMREVAQMNEQDRSLVLKDAQLAVSLLGTNVEEAQIAASRAGLTLDEAQLLVEQAGIGLDQAQMGVKQAQNAAEMQSYDTKGLQLNNEIANIGLDQSQLNESQTKFNLAKMSSPKDLGYELYTDPVTLQREWLTPAQADEKQFQYQQGLGVSRYPTTLRTQQQKTAIESQGNPLYGASESVLKDVLRQGYNYEADPSQNPAPHYNEVLQALILKNQAHGAAAEPLARYELSLLMAQVKAEEDLKRKQAKANAPTLSINTNAQP